MHGKYIGEAQNDEANVLYWYLMQEICSSNVFCGCCLIFNSIKGAHA